MLAQVTVQFSDAAACQRPAAPVLPARRPDPGLHRRRRRDERARLGDARRGRLPHARDAEVPGPHAAGLRCGTEERDVGTRRAAAHARVHVPPLLGAGGQRAQVRHPHVGQRHRHLGDAPGRPDARSRPRRAVPGDVGTDADGLALRVRCSPAQPPRHHGADAPPRLRRLPLGVLALLQRRRLRAGAAQDRPAGDLWCGAVGRGDEPGQRRCRNPSNR